MTAIELSESNQNFKLHLHRSGNGPVLILLHGWGMNAEAYRPLSESMCDEFELQRVDLPGYGRSQWTFDQRLVNDQFESQLQMMATHFQSSTLLGWSMGGLYALRLANLFPHRFKRLVLVASNPCFVSRNDWPGVEASVFDEFSQAFINDWQATIRRFLGLQMFGVDNAREQIRSMSRLLYEGGAPQSAALEFGLELLLQLDLRDQVQQLKVPTLMILGRRDKLVPVAIAEQMQSLNPQVRVECLEHSAHAPFLSHPQEFTGLIREFVKSTATG